MARTRFVPIESAERELLNRLGGSFKPDARLLRRIIADELTPVQLRYLEDYYFNGLGMSRVAELNGVSVSTVSRTLKRARERIRRAMSYAMRK